MRRSVWIFFASILLPSLVLAWLAVRSARDQQVVVEHQQVIISQNITDALAKSIQGQMDQMRADFVAATQQLINSSSSPQAVAESFNSSLPPAWPMAEIGFAVNLNGEVYSPKPYDSPGARTFLDENDRFLTNRENAEVYSFNSLNTQVVQNFLKSSNADSSSLLDQNVTRTAQVVQNLAPASSAAGEAKPISSSQTDSLASADATSAASVDMLIHRASLPSNATSPPAAAANEQEKKDFNASASDVVTTTTTAQSKLQATGSMQAPTGSTASINVTSQPGNAAPQSFFSRSALAPAAASADESAAVDKSARAGSGSAQTSVASVSAPTAAAAPTPTPEEASNRPAPAAPQPLPNNAAVESTMAAPAPLTLNTPSTAKYFGGPGTQVLKTTRNVIPQKELANQSAALSNTVPEESDFRRAIGTGTSGELARFLDDKLRLLVWSRAAADAPIVFGAQLDQEKVVEALKASFQIPELATDSSSGRSDYCVAILDDTGKPVALSQPGITADWKRPFVSTEIGDALPHWEAALYLIDPARIGHAARTLQLTLGLIVLVLVAAIVAGGSLIAADVRRQVRLAQQKTDFVSNVSHELKTPLTSIRMFADLLAEKRVPDEERQSTYLRIIAAEAARLTRLINNVLDFARLEQGKPSGERHAGDLVDAVRDVTETCAPHLEAESIAFRLEVEADKLPIRGDRDALAQIILNLISNAEKYGGGDILVRVRRQETPGHGALGCVDVLDRGPGIPPKDVKTIFEPFHRLDDSLANGIPGSGLGLTLARRMARAHDGDVTYSARSGGGSCFTLTVPLETNST